MSLQIVETFGPRQRISNATRAGGLAELAFAHLPYQHVFPDIEMNRSYILKLTSGGNACAAVKDLHVSEEFSMLLERAG